MNKISSLAYVLILTFLSLQQNTSYAAEIPRRELQFFEKQIRPVLVKHCYECHSDKSKKAEGGLVLDTREGMLVGGESGAAVVPNKIAESILIEAIEYKSFEMPPDKKLPEDVIANFRKWVKMGAPDPRDGKMSNIVTGHKQSQAKQAAELWSLKPVSQANPPGVNNQDWAYSAIDQFLLARLEAKGLEPVSDARPETLLRRVYFDLIGLPPSAEELQQFSKSPSSDALEAIIDKLLASPQFGERWARHWMDVARFAESAGNSRDVLMPHAWRYRDYVIDAYNADIPYDRFITEQLAGDLLPAETSAERDRLRIATGLLAIGTKSLNGGNLQMDIVDEQIDVTGKAILGLTISCARCHDHKFDPIPTKDYYALAGIFKSTDTLYGGGLRRGNKPNQKLSTLHVLGIDADARVQAISKLSKELSTLQKREKTLLNKQKQLRKKLPKNFQARLRELRQNKSANKSVKNADQKNADAEEPNSQQKQKPQKTRLSPKDRIILQFDDNANTLKTTRERIAELQKQNKKHKLEYAVGVRDAKNVADTKIHIRGEKNKLGELAPRGFLTALSNSKSHQINKEQSGRLELAHWLTDPENPLTARVAVNRIWMHLFGRGLVNSVDNFGINGEPPSHPELLDFLSHRFIELGWSQKKFIKELLLTHAYQLSTEYQATNYKADPANTLIWRMSRRRLEAEAIRDAMLYTSGELKMDRPYASAVAEIGIGEVGRNLNIKPLSKPFPHRSVYLPIIRGIVPAMLKTFDLPEPSNPQGQRDRTNVPPQSLFLMNNPFVIKQAEHLAKRAIAEEAASEARIAWLYLTCYSRKPTQEELQTAVKYIDVSKQRFSSDNKQANQSELFAWSSYCQALFAAAEFRFLD